MVFKKIFLLVCFLIFSTKGESQLELVAPGFPLFIGDKVDFRCSASSSDFEDNLKWTFENIGGNTFVPEISADEDLNRSDDGEFHRISYIKLNNSSSVTCSGTKKNGETVSTKKAISFNDATPLPTFEDDYESCVAAKDAPRIILWRYDSGYKSRFWVPHVVTNKTIKLSDQVRNFRLTCAYEKAIQWHFEKFNVVNHPNKHALCFTETLDINPISSASSRKYICSGTIGNDISSFVSIVLPENTPPPSPYARIHDNDTLVAVETIVEKLTETGTGQLYGVGFGSSAASMFMIVGIVFLKRMLQKNRESRQENAQTQA